MKTVYLYVFRDAEHENDNENASLTLVFYLLKHLKIALKSLCI